MGYKVVMSAKVRRPAPGSWSGMAQFRCIEPALKFLGVPGSLGRGQPCEIAKMGVEGVSFEVLACAPVATDAAG